MTTAQRIKTLEKEVSELKSLFSSLVPLDREGEYQAAFLRTTSKAAKEKPVGTYTGKGDLLSL
jgi:hypothetical protein